MSAALSMVQNDNSNDGVTSAGYRTRKKSKPGVPRFRMTSAEKREIIRIKNQPVDHSAIADFIHSRGENLKKKQLDESEQDARVTTLHSRTEKQEEEEVSEDELGQDFNFKDFERYQEALIYEYNFYERVKR